MSIPLPTPRQTVRRKKLVQGETLFRQGDSTFGIFTVLRGRIRLVRHLADGGSLPLYVAHDGDSFSEAALFSSHYHCDAVADLESDVEIHPKDALLQAFAADPGAANLFMSRLARQVIDLRARLEIRNIRSAKERTLQFLQLQGADTAGQVCFARPLKDIAADIGLTHEAFYRALSELEKSGAIRRNGRDIAVKQQI